MEKARTAGKFFCIKLQIRKQAKNGKVVLEKVTYTPLYVLDQGEQQKNYWWIAIIVVLIVLLASGINYYYKRKNKINV